MSTFPYQFDKRLKLRENPAPSCPGAPDERTIAGMLKEELYNSRKILAPTGSYADAELLNSMGIDITGHDPLLVEKVFNKLDLTIKGNHPKVLEVTHWPGAKLEPEFDYSPEEEYYDDGEGDE